ncbi:Flavin-dependent monooxygenase ArsO associated with arsenic resistance (plasmid) [Cupriavidus sp. U2]|uniref:ArsO family NAD(P)H-dependent flavin-containing monooxygenase n=1 Tax=Cupriavidus sp. U2 TaxID=2920269 RepID=UPI00129ED505|nr:ArsO family NAD(P)H-dependent flavin-containing monooxygenase [Cupriavidus sp. U2]KAI3590379.1 Flavin-dependent monooxygenase ArsO associated with arsenic resistance [Cupriavidus sp. U2]
MENVDVVVVGGGQSGLAVSYFLRRTGLSFVVLDSEGGPGGAWQHTWDSLRLFSPAQWSSLPGWPMPATRDGSYPSKAQVVDYLAAYEQRYAIPIRRPVVVHAIARNGTGLVVQTDTGAYSTKALVSATGTWRHPFRPVFLGGDQFLGTQIHSAQYRGADEFAGKRVLVVGGGNSGAQILAEISAVAETTWATLAPPMFLPDSVDGRVLFARATARWMATVEGRPVDELPGGLGDVVMVQSVKDARERGALTSVRMPQRLTATGAAWEDGYLAPFDAIVWCTGFLPATQHLESLGITSADGRVAVNGTRSVAEPRLWLVGYGEWTGFASATLIGVLRSARSTAKEIADALATG